MVPVGEQDVALLRPLEGSSAVRYASSPITCSVHLPHTYFPLETDQQCWQDDNDKGSSGTGRWPIPAAGILGEALDSRAVRAATPCSLRCAHGGDAV